MNFISSVAKIKDELLAQPQHLLVYRLSLVLLLFYGSSGWLVDIPLRIICGLMLISQSLTKSRLLWATICIIMIYGNALEWYRIDNHKYLITYWAFVCFLSASTNHPNEVISWNGRILIGLVFTFAVIWKLIGGEYLNGSFLYFTFLTDSRVEFSAMLLGGLDSDMLPLNRDLLSALREASSDGASLAMIGSQSLFLFSRIASYLTILIEGALAVMFLFFCSGWLFYVCHVLLISFVSFTYFLFPVTGFAFILALMGFAQCPEEYTKMRTVYLILLVLVQFTRIPWSDYAAIIAEQ